jgi:hypothetical protein
MDKIFLDYNTCKRLKSLGFNESCLGYYHNNSINPEVDLFVTGLLKLYSENQNITLACTYEQCLNWLRKEHNIFVICTQNFYWDGVNYLVQVFKYNPEKERCYEGTMLYGDNGEFESYEVSLEFGLNLALKMI